MPRTELSPALLSSLAGSAGSAGSVTPNSFSMAASDLPNTSDDEVPVGDSDDADDEADHHSDNDTDDDGGGDDDDGRGDDANAASLASAVADSE